MAKSPMTLNAKNKRVQGKYSSKVNLTSNVAELDLTVTLKITAKGECSFNLRNWCHLRCQSEASLAKPNRMTQMKSVFQWVKRQQKNQVSDATLANHLHAFKSYITFCDGKDLDPFSKAGYLAYVGNDGKLWRQVELATQTKPYLFQYCDGDELGIKERSAMGLKYYIDSILDGLGFNVSRYQSGLHNFRTGLEITTPPYQPSEWRLMLRRLNIYFTSLATQLIAYRDENPTAPPPQTLEATVDKINGEYVTFNVGTNKGSRDGPTSPFYQCMLAGYLLFAYYTAFNTTSILSVRHPIKPVRTDKAGRTLRYVRIKGYKGRSHKDVQALFQSNPDESTHPEANENGKQVGFIAADIAKRDANGIQDGLTFIEVMSLFSQAYSNDKFGLLFYALDGNKKKKIIVHDNDTLSTNLGLLSSNRSNLTDYLINIFDEIVDNNLVQRYAIVVSPETSFRTIKVEEIKITPRKKKLRTIGVAFAVVSCFTDISLKNILMPLSYSEKDSDGNITVTFNYLDGSDGVFKVAAKYQSFLEKLEAYAATYNPLSRKCVNNPPYLLPLGARRQTYQWDGVKSLIRPDKLRQYGIGHGDFLLSCNASRIRITTSHLEYTEDDKGLSARQILQHSIKTQERIYINGHPTENAKIVSQGIQALVKISEGKHREDAISEVKEELNIPILAYDKYKNRNTPTNPNGVSCSGKPDFVDTKDFHYSARKFAEDEGIITEGDDITCYQYDLCVFCKSAQLVDDHHAVYKLLSFVDAMRDAIVLFPERAAFITNKIERFEQHIAELPYKTLEAAETLLFDNGRYFMFNSASAVAQHLSLR